jgi:tetratricopeptide (TPR) repeat protein
MPSLTSCTHHPKRPAVGICPHCGKPFCEGCMTYRGSRYVCKGCATVAAAETTMVMEGNAKRRRRPDGEESPATQPAPRQESRAVSRYKRKLAFNRQVRRIGVLLVLLGLAVAAYLPALLNLALDQAKTGQWIDQRHVPRLVTLTAQVHILYGRSEQAIAILDRAMPELGDAQQDMATFYLGKANVRLTEYQKAKEHYETFLQRWPQHDGAVEVGEEITLIERILDSRVLNQGERAIQR